MKHTIKVDTTRANLTLDQRTYDNYVNDKNTVNLSNRKTTKQIKQSINNRKQFNTARSMLKWAVLPLIALIVLVIANGIWTTVEADYISNDEYSYYGVDNFQDYSRAIRKETCYRAGTQILWEVTDKQVKHCTTSLTLITAIESANMSSRRCLEDLNCMGLKWWTNWKYWFMKFKTQYAGNMYFSEKWFTYHYKKSLHTLVFGYKQKDWSYRYGWTYTQQNTYYAFLRNNYYRVYYEIENL